MQCKQCGQPLSSPQPGGHRAREFCNRACKQAYYRQRKSLQGDSQELEEARQQIEELEQQVSHLEYLLDVEKRYHGDTTARALPSWLKKQVPSPLIRRLLDEETLPPRGSRSLYEAHLRSRKYSADVMHEFGHLWKLMLLSKS
jgi:phage-related minor tail protein